MPYVLFHDYFPEIAERETRTITMFPGSNVGLPAGEYAFLEMFCDEPGCDCRRVFFYVISSVTREVEAVVAYGWDSPDFYAKWLKYDDDLLTVANLKGPILNFGSPQSRLAPAILDLVQDVLLQDNAYVNRIKHHYKLFREKMDRIQNPKKKRRASPL